MYTMEDLKTNRDAQITVAASSSSCWPSRSTSDLQQVTLTEALAVALRTTR